MSLKRFIKKFVRKDADIRLWLEHNNKLHTIHCENVDVANAQETLDGKTFQSELLKWKVTCVINVSCESNGDAINIVIG